MDNTISELTSKQIKFIDHLLTEPSFEQACKKAHVSKNTALQWRKAALFQKAYREAKISLFKQSNKNLLTQVDGAIQTLIDIKDNQDNGANVRVTASKAIIDYAFKGFEASELADRISELESRIAE